MTMMLKILCEIPLDTEELILGIKKKKRSCKWNETEMLASASPLPDHLQRVQKAVYRGPGI